MSELVSAVYSEESMVNEFINSNGLISAVLYSLCKSCGRDYGEVLSEGAHLYCEQMRRREEARIVALEESVRENVAKDVVERGVMEEVVSYDDDALFDMWVRDYDRFKRGGEEEKLGCLLELIENSERVGLVKRFKRLIGNVGDLRGLVG